MLFNQSALDFPQPLTEKYRPRAIADFIGLDKPRKIVTRLVDNPRAIGLLFKGPSGTGKTTLALAMADAMPAELHHIPSQECTVDNLKRVVATCQYVPMSGAKMHLVLIDEADQMSNAAQLYLLSKLDSTGAMPNTVFIFTANATDRLEGRFLSRVLNLDFSSYGMANGATSLLEQVWNAEAESDAVKPNFARIVKEANNNVREALMRLEVELLAR